MKKLKLVIPGLIILGLVIFSIVNIHNEKKSMVDVISSENYDDFKSLYLSLENKDTYIDEDGALIPFIGWSLLVDDSRFFDLIVMHADPNSLLDPSSDVSKSVIFITSTFCAVDKAKKLISRGANVNVSFEGFTLLHYVAGTKCYPLAKLFIEHGANKKALNKNGLTPSEFAAKNGNIKMSEILK